MVFSFLVFFFFFFTSFSQLLLAFGCLSFNKQLYCIHEIFYAASCVRAAGEQIRLSCHFRTFVRMWQIWIMKGNTRRRLLIAEEIIMNIWEISPLNPGQLIFSSDWINFFIFPSVEINILSVICLFYEYEFVSVFLPFSFYLIWNCDIYSPLASCENKYIPLYLEEQSLENHLSGEMISCDMTVFPTPTAFRLDIHKHGWS